jgi:hypothetical protein
LPAVNRLCILRTRYDSNTTLAFVRVLYRAIKELFHVKTPVSYENIIGSPGCKYLLEELDALPQVSLVLVGLNSTRGCNVMQIIIGRGYPNISWNPFSRVIIVVSRYGFDRLHLRRKRPRVRAACGSIHPALHN